MPVAEADIFEKKFKFFIIKSLTRGEAIKIKYLDLETHARDSFLYCLWVLIYLYLTNGIKYISKFYTLLTLMIGLFNIKRYVLLK